MAIQRPPRPLPPRGLILLASAWLVVAWILSIGWRPPVQAHAASYTPGVRMLLLSLVVGIGIAWPLVRLSGPARAWPIRQALLDVAVLLCLAQVVVWPLRLVTPWTPLRSAAIDLTLGGWAFAATALVALGTVPRARFDTVARSLCMAIAVVFIGLVPMALLLRGETIPLRAAVPPEAEIDWWREVAASPVTAMHALTGGGANEPTATEWNVALAGWRVAAATWGLVLVLALLRSRRPLSPSPVPAGVALGGDDP